METHWMCEVTQVIVDESRFEEVKNFLESKANEFKRATRTFYRHLQGRDVETISALLVTREHTQKGIIVGVEVRGLDWLEGQIEDQQDLDPYLDKLEELGATPHFEKSGVGG